MAACGTPAGYHAHYRAKEPACAECKAAVAEVERQRRMDAKAQAAEDFEEALSLEPEVEEGIDVLGDLRENLRIVRAQMRVSKSWRERSDLSKQRMALVEKISELEAELNKSKGVLGGYADRLADVLSPDFGSRNTGT